jgi:hypothetical protein
MHPHIELAIAGTRTAERIRHAEQRRAADAARAGRTPDRQSIRTAFGRRYAVGSVR